MAKLVVGLRSGPGSVENKTNSYFIKLKYLTGKTLNEYILAFR